MLERLFSAAMRSSTGKTCFSLVAIKDAGKDEQRWRQKNEILAVRKGRRAGGSAVKDTHCSYRGLGEFLAPSSAASLWPITSVPGDLTSSAGLCGHLHTLGAQEFMQAHIHINKNKQINEYLF